MNWGHRVYLRLKFTNPVSLLLPRAISATTRIFSPHYHHTLQPPLLRHLRWCCTSISCSSISCTVQLSCLSPYCTSTVATTTLLWPPSRRCLRWCCTSISCTTLSYTSFFVFRQLSRRRSYKVSFQLVFVSFSVLYILIFNFGYCEYWFALGLKLFGVFWVILWENWVLI